VPLTDVNGNNTDLKDTSNGYNRDLKDTNVRGFTQLISAHIKSIGWWIFELKVLLVCLRFYFQVHFNTTNWYFGLFLLNWFHG